MNVLQKIFGEGVVRVAGMRIATPVKEVREKTVARHRAAGTRVNEDGGKARSSRSESGDGPLSTV